MSKNKELTKGPKNGQFGREYSERMSGKIKVRELITRVQHFALGEPGSQGERVDMNARQLKAALSLIDKCLPNLHSTEYMNVTPKRRPDEIQADLASLVQNLDARTFAQLKGLISPPEPIDVIPEQTEH